MFHAYLDVCTWLLLWVLIGLDWVLPMMLLNSHVTCSRIFHAYVLFLSTLNMCLHSVLSLSLSFSLSLSLSLTDRLRHDTQTVQIYSGSESSWFRVIFFFYSSRTLLYLVPWWEGLEGLLWELPGSWHSSGTPGHSVGFLRHNATWSHSNSRMGISIRKTRVLSCLVYTGVLLQHIWHQYLCASVCFYIQRYTYSSYLRSCYRGTMCS